MLIGRFALGAVIQKYTLAAGDSARGLKTIGDYWYVLNEAKDGVILEDYIGTKGGDIVIPSTIDGLPVVKLEALLFCELGKPPYGKKRKDRITSVVIPDTVISINNCFKGCEDLKQITLPKNLKIIGDDTFKWSGLTSIVIPEGVTEIGSRAFEACANLTSVTLPQSIRRMGDSAFGSCTSLVDVNIPQKVIEYFSGYSDQEKYDTGSFKGSSKISASSQQAIRDTSYKGKF